MNNVVFGKTMENIRKHRNIKLITNQEAYLKVVMKPNFKSGILFGKNLMGCEMGKIKVVMSKPVYLGQAIIDISKIIMYKFHYDYTKQKYNNDNFTLCYMDMDSLIYSIEMDDFYKDIANDIKDRFDMSSYNFKSPKCKVLDQPDVKDTLHKLHANYVLVPADKAANNVIIVCKKYYIDTLVKELGINNVNINNPTYIPIDDSFETIMKSHNQFITSVGLEISEEDQNLPYLYWTPKLHKSPYKHRFIAGSSKCTTKDLSCLLTKVLSTIKDGLVRYCNTKTSRNGVNNRWILKNSTSLLSSLDQLDVHTAAYISPDI